jgi:hypothetical protein
MSSSFKFDKNAFMREVQREAQKGIDQMAREQNRELECMSATYAGRRSRRSSPRCSACSRATTARSPNLN